MHQTTQDPKYLSEAIRLTDIVESSFKDEEAGGYYLTSIHHERLISRTKEAYDGAIPSGNSIMAHNLLKLSRLTDELQYQSRYDLLIAAFGGSIKKKPSYFAYLLGSLIHRESGTKDLVIVVKDDQERIETLTTYGLKSFNYFTWKIIIDKTESSDKRCVNQQRTFYICEDFACKATVFELPRGD
jgi:uncharacterized protein YyaL (SSP411 family)